jgi:hypothetical protein
MIASRTDAQRLPRVRWRRVATHSLNSLMDFLAASAFGDPKARRKQIYDAVESLRYSPLRCPVTGVKDGMTFRRLTVEHRYYVYYVYSPPRGMSSGGTLSIRSVKHAASERPFLGVRESDGAPSAMLTPRDPAAELFTIA